MVASLGSASLVSAPESYPGGEVLLFTVDFKAVSPLEEGEEQVAIKSEFGLKDSHLFCDQIGGDPVEEDVTIEGECINTWLAKLSQQQLHTQQQQQQQQHQEQQEQHQLQEQQNDERVTLEYSPTHFARHIQETSLIANPISPPPSVHAPTSISNQTLYIAENLQSQLANQVNRGIMSLSSAFSVPRSHQQPHTSRNVSLGPQLQIVLPADAASTTGTLNLLQNSGIVVHQKQHQLLEAQFQQPSPQPQRNTIVNLSPGQTVGLNRHHFNSSTSAVCNEPNPLLPSFDTSFSPSNVPVDGSVTVSLSTSGDVVLRPTQQVVQASPNMHVYSRRADGYLQPKQFTVFGECTTYTQRLCIISLVLYGKSICTNTNSVSNILLSTSLVQVADML